MNYDSPRSGGGVVEWLIGWMFVLLVLSFAAEALVVMIRPLLPWIGLAALGLFGTALWLRRRSDHW